MLIYDNWKGHSSIRPSYHETQCHIHCYFNKLIQLFSFFDKAGMCHQNNWANGFQCICINRRKAGEHFTYLLVNLSWYDIANHSRLLIGSCLWSVYRRTLFKTSWFHVAVRPSSIKITHDFKMWKESTTFSRHLWSILLYSFLEDSRRVSRIS